MQFYRQLVLHHWKSIALLVVLCLCGSAAYLRLAPAQYQAEAQLFVGTTSRAQDSAGLNQSGQYAQARVKSYVALVTTPRVLDPVRETLGLAETSAELAEQVSANVPVDTVLINVEVVAADPEFARDVADAVSQQLAVEIQRLETPPAGGTSQITVVPTRSADLPTTPTGQSTAAVLTLGLLLGLALGLGYAFFSDVLRPRLRDSSDVEVKLGVPVLAVLPGDSRGTPQVVLKHLRAQLTTRSDAADSRSLFLAAAAPERDTARLALDLAESFAASGKSVVLLDGDLERRGLTRLTGSRPQRGLADVLNGTPVEYALTDFGVPGVVLLGGHGNAGSGLEIVYSPALVAVLGELEALADLVIISGASAGEDADALVWAKVAAGTAVVVQKGAAESRVRGTLDLVQSVQASVLGIVLQTGRSHGRRPAGTWDDFTGAGSTIAATSET